MPDLQVFQISPRELRMRHHLDLPIPLLADRDRVAQVAHPVIHLDFIMQEFFKGRNIKDLVRGWLGGVDDELFLC